MAKTVCSVVQLGELENVTFVYYHALHVYLHKAPSRNLDLLKNEKIVQCSQSKLL